VSASGAAVGLLLAISSLQDLMAHTAQRGVIASLWLRLLLGPVAAAQATLAVLVGIWALVLIVRHWNHLGRAQSMVHALTNRVPSQAHARLAQHSAKPCFGTALGEGSGDYERSRELAVTKPRSAAHSSDLWRLGPDGLP
jgi:hypothetical protein